MLFYFFLLFLKICVILNFNPTIVTCYDNEDSCEKKLIKSISDYGQSNNVSGCQNIEPGTDRNNGMITQHVFKYFEENVLIIFKQIYNDYIINMTKEKSETLDAIEFIKTFMLLVRKSLPYNSQNTNTVDQIIHESYYMTSYIANCNFTGTGIFVPT